MKVGKLSKGGLGGNWLSLSREKEMYTFWRYGERQTCQPTGVQQGSMGEDKHPDKGRCQVLSKRRWTGALGPSLGIIPAQTIHVILGNLAFLSYLFPHPLKNGDWEIFKVLSILKIVLFYDSKPVN